MTPYVVTTKRRPEGWRGEKEPLRTLSRRAVATLDEAKAEANEVVGRAFESDDPKVTPPEHEAWLAVHYLPESGGTITLPDGTVIEVMQVTMDSRVGADSAWSWLASEADMPDPADVVVAAEDGDREAQQRILDAYNARQRTAAARTDPTANRTVG